MAWWKTAKVGDKVVCILEVLSDSRPHHLCTGSPVKGRIYTIVRIVLHPRGRDGIAIDVGPGGLANPILFRPVVNRSPNFIGAPVTEGVGGNCGADR